MSEEWSDESNHIFSRAVLAQHKHFDSADRPVGLAQHKYFDSDRPQTVRVEVW